MCMHLHIVSHSNKFFPKAMTSGFDDLHKHTLREIKELLYSSIVGFYAHLMRCINFFWSDWDFHGIDSDNKNAEKGIRSISKTYNVISDVLAENRINIRASEKWIYLRLAVKNTWLIHTHFVCNGSGQIGIFMQFRFKFHVSVTVATRRIWRG